MVWTMNLDHLEGEPGSENMSRFDLMSVLFTADAAIPRVLPLLIKWPAPTLPEVYDVIVALNPLVSQILSTFAAIWLQWVLTAFTFSVAWNDRFWSILPPLWGVLYACHPFISHDNKTSGKLDVRLSLMAALTLLWGLRLTYNGVRRGVYSWGHEDYRFLWVRTTKVTNRFVFWCLYLIFVCGHCTVVLSLISTPFYFAWIRRGDAPVLNFVDIFAASGMLSGIVMQAVSDNQQWQFHLRKHALRQSEEPGKTDKTSDTERDMDEEQGFCQSGLFAWCRHPSYFAEMAIWSFFYLFSVSTSGTWVNWCISGPILYILLFQLTTPLAEAISSSKYPSYAAYQLRVSRLFPLPPKSREHIKKH